MPPEAGWSPVSSLAMSMAWPLLSFFVALPALSAWRRRARSRDASQLATDVAGYAEQVRRESRCLPLDPELRGRLQRCRADEWAALQLALDVARHDAALLADAASRLALRLRRRVAFERKMLARTADGLRRGAIAASLPPIAMLLLAAMEFDIPAAAMLALFGVETLGCLLLWRLSSVEI